MQIWVNYAITVLKSEGFTALYVMLTVLITPHLTRSSGIPGQYQIQDYNHAFINLFYLPPVYLN